MQGNRPQRGVSLVELLVAMAILATVLTPLLGIFMQALKTSMHANRRTIARSLAREMVEEIRSKPFIDPLISLRTGTMYPRGTTPQPFGFNASGENDGTYNQAVSRLRQFDDVDDYNGWCRGPRCNCAGVTPAGICDATLPLEDYNGTRYAGTGFAHYQGFTRQVQVFNVTPATPGTHSMEIGRGAYRDEKNFRFYDLRSEQMTAAANGMTNLKAIRVTVTYSGGTTPEFSIEDVALTVLPVGRDSL